MNRNVRVKKIQKKGKKTVIFWKDEGSLYTAPYNSPGAQLVTPEQLKKARETKTVILVSEEVKPGV